MNCQSKWGFLRIKFAGILEQKPQFGTYRASFYFIQRPRPLNKTRLFFLKVEESLTLDDVKLLGHLRKSKNTAKRNIKHSKRQN